MRAAHLIIIFHTNSAKQKTAMNPCRDNSAKFKETYTQKLYKKPNDMNGLGDGLVESDYKLLQANSPLIAASLIPENIFFVHFFIQLEVKN